jgi:hypothetical protein
MLGPNGLIGAINAPLGDYFGRNILEIFSKSFFKKIFKFFFKNYNILLRFVLKIFQKKSFSKFSKSIYKSFYCLKTMVTSPFALLLKIQMLMK